MARELVTNKKYLPSDSLKQKRFKEKENKNKLQKPRRWIFMGHKCSSFCRPSVTVNGRRYRVVKELGEGGERFSALS